MQEFLCCYLKNADVVLYGTFGRILTAVSKVALSKFGQAKKKRSKYCTVYNVHV